MDTSTTPGSGSLIVRWDEDGDARARSAASHLPGGIHLDRSVDLVDPSFACGIDDVEGGRDDPQVVVVDTRPPDFGALPRGRYVQATP